MLRNSFVLSHDKDETTVEPWQTHNRVGLSVSHVVGLSNDTDNKQSQDCNA